MTSSEDPAVRDRSWPSGEAPVGSGRIELVRLAPLITRLQGCYYLGGGLWRLLHRRSFDTLAGPKPDPFQTDVTAALFSAAGVALLAGTTRGHWDATTRVLATCAGLATATVDLRHRRRIRTLFMLEALVELVMAAAGAAPIRSPRGHGWKAKRMTHGA